MTATPRLAVHTGLALTGLAAALLTRRVDVLVTAVPFVLLVLVGLAGQGAPAVDVAVAVEPTQVLEGDPLEVRVTLASSAGCPRVDVALTLPAGARLASGEAVRALALVPGEARTETFEVVCDRWGLVALGGLVLRSTDRAGLRGREQVLAPSVSVRVYPPPQRLRELAPSRRYRRSPGERVARRQTGAGLELADLRPFQPGDRPRDVNWRVTARRGELWVTERHPDRATDVVVFVDTFSEPMLVPAVRAASALVDAYLGTRDRVGLVAFGGLLRWVRGGSGARQRVQVVDALLDARVAFSYVWRDARAIPPAVLVPGALVVGLTPLEDERAVAALADLRARGFDVAVIELDPTPSVPAPTGPRDGADAVAWQLWQARREDRRDWFRRLGIPVAPWRDGEPLHATMEALWLAAGAPSAPRLAATPR